MARIITIWQRFDNNTKLWEHNHISDGYDEKQIVPVGTPEQNKLWKGGTWRKFEGTLTNTFEVVCD